MNAIEKIASVKATAYAKYDEFVSNGKQAHIAAIAQDKNVYNALLHFPFDNDGAPTNGILDQKVVVKAVQEFDPSFCLGKTTLLGVFLEKHFPEVTIEFAEVFEDFFRSILYQDIHISDDITLHQEFLLYEEPHNVIVVGGTQFEPLSQIINQNISHPKINRMDFWNGVTASVMIAEANSTNSVGERMKILNQAESICPEMLLIQENKVSGLYASNHISEAYILLKTVNQKRKTARGLFVLAEVYNDTQAKKKLFEIYGEKIYHLIRKEVNL